MKFGPVAVAEAEGALLAHSLHVNGRRIAKGSVLDGRDLEALTAAGVETITVAQLDPLDVHEDAAARALAEALVPDPIGQGLRISGAGAGRVNLYATGAGVVRIEAAQIHAVNAVDAMISVATVPDYHRVDHDGMVATIKIISYAVPQARLAQACSQAQSQTGLGALCLHRPVFRSASLIETMVREEVPSDKGRAAMAGRLDRLGVALTPRVLAPHDITALQAEIRAAQGEVIFILTGSATSDSRDVAPQALREAGGQVERFGMPVDPGNLLFLGRFGEKPVIGLPGCARSPALNGADWVLERVICGLEPGSADIAAMGVGGLLKEIPTRPRPRHSDHG